MFLARYPEQICLIRNRLVEELKHTPSVLLKEGRKQGIATELLIDGPPDLDDPFFPGLIQ